MAAEYIVRGDIARWNDLRHLGWRMRSEFPSQDVVCLRNVRLVGGEPDPRRSASGERNSLGVLSVVDVIRDVDGGHRGNRTPRNCGVWARSVRCGNKGLIDKNRQGSVAGAASRRSVFDDGFVGYAVGA